MKDVPCTLAMLALLACDPAQPEVPKGDTGDCFTYAWPDADGDGYGDPEGQHIEACILPEGYSLSDDDCDDGDPNVHPGADEHCDGVDEDCDGAIDEDAVDPTPWYHDLDGDGYGDESSGGSSCEVPSDGSTVGGDCDDDDATVHPGATEDCDGVDQDCDGEIDDDCHGCDVTVPDNYATIQAAIDDVEAGSTVCVEAGTWVENIDFRGKDLWLVGIEGPELTVIDGGDAGSVVRMTNGESAQARLSGFTLRNGIDAQGGGINVQGASPRMSDLIITDCAAYDGGGIFLGGSDSELWDVQVDDCQTLLSTADRGWGGGVFVTGGAPSFTRLRVEGCEALTAGGCIAVSEAAPTFQDIEIIHCYAQGASNPAGGGLSLSDSGGSVNGAYIEGNGAVEGDGGGLYLDTSDTTLVDVELAWNGAEDGGGAYFYYSSPDITRLSVHDNQNDGGDGAGLYMYESSPTCQDVVVSDNTISSPGRGGGWYLHNSSPVCSDVIISGNTAERALGGGMLAQGTSTPSFEHVTISGNTGDNGGAGIYLEDDAILTLSQAVISGNRTASADGGAAWVGDQARLIMDHAVVVSNDVGSRLGAAFHLEDSGRLRLDSAIVTANNSSWAPVVDAEDRAQVSLSFVSIESNHGDTAIRTTGTNRLELSHVTISGTNNGTAVDMDGEGIYAISWSNAWNNAEGDWDNLGQGSLTNDLAVEPAYLDLSPSDPLAWDLHLDLGSQLIDAGDPTVLDPDGSPADVGAFGGPGADGWDLDRDGYPAWWQPGPYDSASYPATGWDCDDHDASVYPGAGC